jgi:tRNA (guanine-N7-)-methyltransferase
MKPEASHQTPQSFEAKSRGDSEVPRQASAFASLYGRRKGKKLRSHQEHLLETLLPRLALDLSQPIADAAALFTVRPREIWLEIGFGGGEHLAAEAMRQPDIGFIGCEPFVNGVAKLLALIEAEDFGNVRLHQGDAGAVIDWLPPRCLDGLWLLYPDPWPKRRQRKRRFLSDEMLERLARIMRTGAEIRFATDIDDNAGWTLARILRSPFFTWPARSERDWQEPWDNWVRTRYEAKAVAAGRRPAYFTFVRV